MYINLTKWHIVVFGAYFCSSTYLVRNVAAGNLRALHKWPHRLPYFFPHLVEFSQLHFEVL